MIQAPGHLAPPRSKVIKLFFFTDTLDKKFVHGKHFQPSLIFTIKDRCFIIPSSSQKFHSYLLGLAQTLSHILDLAEKTCQGQTLYLIRGKSERRRERELYKFDTLSNKFCQNPFK
jgi:hypothetical protein